MGVDVNKHAVYTEVEAFEDGWGEYKQPEVIEGVPKTLVRATFSIVVNWGEVNVRRVDALEMVNFQKGS